MSEIDQYKHECIGMVSCPSSFLPAAYWRNPARMIPIYRIDQDTTEGDSFSAKRGDLLVGGGSGECPALRISIPETFFFLTHKDWELEENHWYNEFCKAYWSLNQAYVFCDGYFRLGWHPYEGFIEVWLARHILAFVLREYPDVYSHWKGPGDLEESGDICRLPTAEEKADL